MKRCALLFAAVLLPNLLQGQILIDRDNPIEKISVESRLRDLKLMVKLKEFTGSGHSCKLSDFKVADLKAFARPHGDQEVSLNPQGQETIEWIYKLGVGEGGILADDWDSFDYTLTYRCGNRPWQEVPRTTVKRIIADSDSESLKIKPLHLFDDGSIDVVATAHPGFASTSLYVMASKETGTILQGINVASTTESGGHPK